MKIAKAIGALIYVASYGLITAAAATIIYGWLLSTLWNWFLVPLGAPVITIAHACGIWLIVSVVTAKEPTHTDDRHASDRTAGAVMYMVVFPALAYIVGMIIHGLMR